MLWSALRLPWGEGTPAPSTGATLPGISTWALQFTPRVAVVDEAVLMEVAASVRLFGGKRALRDRVVAEATELGVAQVAWSATSLGALALARAGIENGFKKPHAEMMSALPLPTLNAARPHLPTLARLGCNTVGDVQRLPRGGISRRFDAGLLKALDQLYGLQPEVHRWATLPDSFSAQLELMARVEHAPALLQGARRLLLQMSGWLAARHCGITAFTLRWAHDAMRAKSVDTHGEITIRTATPMRDVDHLSRLLVEHLARVKLPAPVGDLALHADDITPLSPPTATLLPDTVRPGEPLALLLERLAARLGPERVLRPVLREDFRPEAMTHWQPATEPLPRHLCRSTNHPMPTVILREPLPLALRDNKPLYQGPLQLLLGPHRIEGAWWDVDEALGTERTTVRDYWVAHSERAGTLWVYQGFEPQPGWFLHGMFA